MNVWLVFLPVLYSISIITGNVLVSERGASLTNSIATREALFLLSKYYASIHKPYNVKKYVPYKPSNNSNTVQIPPTLLLPAVPEPTTPFPANNVDWDNTNAENYIEETSDISIYSTTETSTSTTEIPEMSTSLLSIIGTTPGFETTTSYYYDTLVASTEEDYSNSSTTDRSLTDEVAITPTSLAPEPETTTETSSTSFIDTTTENAFTIESTSSQPASTMEVENMKSQLNGLTSDSPTTVEITTNINFVLPATLSQPDLNSTTEVPISTTQEPQTTTSAEQETTTDKDGTTTQFPTSTTESATQTSTELPDTSTSLLFFTTEPASTTSPQTDLPDTTTQLALTAESPLAASSLIETTTDVQDTTTNLAVTSTTETASSESTTTEIPFIPTKSFSIETTTETVVIEETTTVETTTTAIKNAVLVEEIIQPKPRKFTYSSDVMPETDW